MVFICKTVRVIVRAFEIPGHSWFFPKASPMLGFSFSLLFSLLEGGERDRTGLGVDGMYGDGAGLV